MVNVNRQDGGMQWLLTDGDFLWKNFLSDDLFLLVDQPTHMCYVFCIIIDVLFIDDEDEDVPF